MDIKELFKQIAEAKEEASPTCLEGKEHTFKTLSHMDGKDSYTWVYKCDKCNEVVKQTSMRTAEDAAYWA